MPRSIINLVNYYAFQSELKVVPEGAVLFSLAIDSIVDLLPSLELETINTLFVGVADQLSLLEQRFADVRVGYVGTGEYFIYAEKYDLSLISEVMFILHQLQSLKIAVGGSSDYKIQLKLRCGYSIAKTSGPIETLAYECKVALLSASVNASRPHRYNSTDPLTSPVAAGTYNIAKGLSEGELFAVYQPKVDLQTGHIVGAEALIRWQKGDKLVSPLAFIPVAERTYEILLIGDFMLEQSKTFIQHLKPPEDFSLSINLSPKQLEFPDYLQRVKPAVNELAAHKVHLEFEVTEQAQIDMAYANHFLTELRALGAELCIDDFGTGYSSFYYLCNIEARTLKIDRSLTARVLKDKKVERVVSGIFQLARSLGFKTVAEGIETKSERDWMLEHDCDYGQGFLFHKPLTVDAFKKVYHSY